MNRAWPVSWSVAAFMAVAAAGVLLRPFLPIDETRYLAVAWEMHLSGDWFVPTKNGEIYTHKPPLLFWLINLVWAATGVSETAARLVAPAFAGLAIALTARLAGLLWPGEPQIEPQIGRQIGRRAALVLASFSVFALFGGATMFDAMLTVATLAGLIALLRALTGGGRGDWARFGAAIALGVLAKGPVIFFHLMPALALYPLWLARADRPPLRQVLTGAVTALLVALGLVGLWLGPALALGGPEYREAVLWTQSAGRMAQSFAHARPWWFYPAMLPALLFPWFWSPALWRAAAAARLDRGMRFALVWALGSALLFGLISAKQIHYLLPVLPAAALLIGRAMPDDVARTRFAAATVPVLLLAAATLALALGASDDPDIRRLLTPAWAIWVWAGLAAGLCALTLRLPHHAGHFALGLGLVLTLDILIGLAEVRETYDSHRIGQAMAAREAAGAALNQGGYHAEFNFAGRLSRPVETVLGEDGIAAWAAAHPQGLIVGQTAHATVPWAPREIVIFRNRPYGLWYVEDAAIGAGGDG